MDQARVRSTRQQNASSSHINARSDTASNVVSSSRDSVGPSQAYEDAPQYSVAYEHITALVEHTQNPALIMTPEYASRIGKCILAVFLFSQC